MQNVSVQIKTGTYVGNEIDDQLLGVNMRSHHNRMNEGSDFLQVMDQIDTNLIRFAGGTISEEHFDITDPDATRVTNVMHLIHPELIPERTNGVPITRTVTPLSDYLNYVNEIEGDPVIVLPTYRFFDQETRGITSNAEADIREFVRDVLADEYGDVDKLTIEIGNEYYQDFRFNWTLTEFGSLQAQIAEWIDDEVSSLGLREDLTLLAQAARNFNDNISLASHFPPASQATVDGVILHFYGTSSIGDPLRMGANIPRELSETTQAWTSRLGEDFDIAVTEWNVGESGEDTTIVNGIMRSAPLLHMFAEMVRGGVDMSMLWAARTDGPSGLSLRSESGSELTPTGYFYKMLTESTNGKRLVDPGATGHKLLDQSGQHVGYTYTFENDGRSVTYFASGVNEAIQLSADLTAQMQSGAYTYTRTLDVVEGDQINGYYSDAAITYDAEINLEVRGGQQVFQIELGAYELVELHVVHGQGVVKEGDTENNIADNLVGSDFDDKLAGSLGWDKLDGLGGNDLLDGGNGKDILRGKSGDDILFGDNGKDHLMGGAGNDELHGGKGNDRLMGHNGDDELFGGVGQDRLFGENDNDEVYGGNGKDSIFGGNGDDLLSGDNGKDYIVGGDGDDRLIGGSGGDSLNGSDGNDILLGGSGFDILNGDAGDDILSGEAGNDRFVFTAGEIGSDRITDFGNGADRIDLTDFALSGFEQLTSATTDTAEGALLDLGAGQSFLLEGVDAGDLQSNQFIF